MASQGPRQFALGCSPQLSPDHRHRSSFIEFISVIIVFSASGGTSLSRSSGSESRNSWSSSSSSALTSIAIFLSNDLVNSNDGNKPFASGNNSCNLVMHCRNPRFFNRLGHLVLNRGGRPISTIIFQDFLSSHAFTQSMRYVCKLHILFWLRFNNRLSSREEVSLYLSLPDRLA